MAECVVILGAGASKPFGVPTLRELFSDPKAQDYLNATPYLKDYLQQVFWAPHGLNADTACHGPTIEEIMTTIRDFSANNYDCIGKLPKDAVSYLGKCLNILIKKAVYDDVSSKGRYLNKLIDYTESTFTHTTWGSFNWDCLFESSYYYNSGPPRARRYNPRLDLKVGTWLASDNQSTLFLKLHGGVNWWREGKELKYCNFSPKSNLNINWQEYAADSSPSPTKAPVLLEPSYYKYDDPAYEIIEPQWQTFVKKMITADVIIIIGYSLPEADPKAIQALRLAFYFNGKAKYLAFNPDQAIRERYVQAFGRQRLRYIEKAYNEIPDIGNCINAELHALQG